jgi:hypothetical protein
MTESMSVRRFRALAETYGGSLERWPAAERRTARELLLREPSLRAALAAESDLDRLLAEGEGGAVSASLLARLESIPEQSSQRQPFPLKPRSFWLPAVGWAVAAGFGLWIGTTLEQPELDAVAVQQAGAGEMDEPTVMEIAAGDLSDLEIMP